MEDLILFSLYMGSFFSKTQKLCTKQAMQQQALAACLLALPQREAQKHKLTSQQRLYYALFLVLHGRLNVTEGGLSNSFPAIMLSTPLKGHIFMSSICVDTKTDYPFFCCKSVQRIV
jgi:hypothetical protein